VIHSRIRQVGHFRALGLGVLGLLMFPGAALLRAQSPEESVDTDTSAYHRALLAYKAGKYQDAYDFLDHARDSIPAQDAEKVAILDSKILIELQRYDEGEKVLRPLLPPNGSIDVQVALGDILLHKRSFDRASKYYGLALKAKPDDPDITLKLVYARIGAGDLVGAGQYASKLQPMDPKNPYDPHASYYFAKAALAQATGNMSEAESEIQEARTNYGITVTNRYLKTYLEFFATVDKGPASELTPPPRIKDVPSK
jgi:tetratricopeptide (TPR) repeat protein